MLRNFWIGSLELEISEQYKSSDFCLPQSLRFRTIWGWVYNKYILRWTIPLKVLYVELTVVELGITAQNQIIVEGFFHPAPPPQTQRHAQVARLMTPTRSSAYEDDWNEIPGVSRQLVTRGAEIQLGKLAVGGFHKPKQRQTFGPGE